MNKASTNIHFYKNENGPVIRVTVKPVIEKDGLYFRDLTGDGRLAPYKDWRNTPAKRAASLAAELSADEKIGMLFVNSWKMGIYQEDRTKVDESGLLNEEIVEQDESIFNVENTYGTTCTVKEMGIRHFILRQNPRPGELADWINQLNMVAEGTGHALPVMVLSNSRNEHGEIVFGMNDEAGVFATWPGTMGIAAAVRGNGPELIDSFAECIRREWDAVGMKKGYMYMADVMTDPRWQRTYGTFGEDPELIYEIMDHIIPRIQGSAEGVTPQGVAVTTKHFPGGGARENGFDPHYAAGQWNVYATEGSLQKYHIPAFKAAVKNHTSSIMPYYSKPSAEKSALQRDCNGEKLEFQPFGFAYNRPFIQEMLREQMGFEGYINSDTGIVHNMSWGVEMLDIPERIGFAVNHAGVDLISGLYDNEAGMEAYMRGKNAYYETHPIPEGFQKEQLILTDEALDRAVARTLQELFELGMFENPYRDPKEAVKAVAEQKDWDAAAKAHRQSVVLLKNKDVLPLTEEKLKGKNIYVEAFHKDAEQSKKSTEALKEMFSGVMLTENLQEADFAILMISPSSGEYFNATQGYLELDICEEKVVCNVSADGKPESGTHKETTLAGADRIKRIADAVHKNGGKVISNINFTLAWLVKNVETQSDALLAGFDTYPNATLDVILGRFAPVGKLPVTLPRGEEVLAVNAEGVCISPNDVPGYDKDLYMPDEMKDENGKAYAYRDSMGNYYELNFGLSYPGETVKE